MNQYENFKYLLEYFVAHLEWLVNKEVNGRGYKEYINPLINAHVFYETGQGYNNGNIQNQIKKWSNYDNGEIYISIQSNYGSYDSTKCYLNWAETGINITAIWKGNKINSLELQEYHWWKKPPKRIKLDIQNSINELGLFDKNIPNNNLNSFFYNFNSLLTDWNRREQMEQEMKNIQPYINILQQNKNLILTGAPGTGKTHLAKLIAKHIIGVQTDEELENSGQFNFVQFHPSYDYTDFVEGLRPTIPDINGNLGFEIRDGIFKDFCKKARSVSAVNIGRINNFTLDDYEIYLKTLELHPSTIKIYKLKIEQLLGKDLNTRKKISNRTIYSNLDDICQNFQDIKDFDTSNGLHNQFSASVSNLIDFKDSLLINKHTISDAKPIFVFVIDEINRGEISKIFGELFFSIDPNYRGKKGAVKTQYSNLHIDDKELFYVPENVYIIGSMNDIDRSVDSFDFAMRRRFIWKEITSEESAKNMNLPENIRAKMTSLNNEILNIDGLNNSYQIGGAYFLDINGNPQQDFDVLWQLRIEPLLKEYLRGMPDSEEKIEKLKIAYNV